MSKPSGPTALNGWHHWMGRQRKNKIGMWRWSKQLKQATKNKGTKTDLVRALFRANEDALSVVGQAKQPNNQVGEGSSPVKPKKERNVGKEKEVLVESPSKEKKITGKGNWKKIAREKEKKPKSLVLEPRALLREKREKAIVKKQK